MSSDSTVIAELLTGYRAALQACDHLDPLNASAVRRVVAKSSGRAHETLVTRHSGGGLASELSEFAAAAARGDLFAKGGRAVSQLLGLVGVAALLGILVGLLLGGYKLVVNLASMAFRLGTSLGVLLAGVLVFLAIRAFWEVGNGGVKLVVSGLRGASRTTEPAVDTLARTVDGPERAFYAQYGGRPAKRRLGAGLSAGVVAVVCVLAVVGFVLLGAIVFGVLQGWADKSDPCEQAPFSPGCRETPGPSFPTVPSTIPIPTFTTVPTYP